MNSRKKGVILVVDDEPLKRITLQIDLTDAGYEVLEASEARTGLQRLEANPVDVVVTDLKMPGSDGLTFLEQIKAKRPDTFVIVMTAFGTVETAVAAIKRGAYDYITKPFTTDVLIEKLERIAHYNRDDALSADTDDALGPLVGRCEAMRNLFREIRTVAETERTVLISGESGTGKELVAESIHRLSPRVDKALVRFACAALQPTVLESELFGHEKGAFTGAIRRKAGRFELADGGTMFLDEVDDIPPEVQVKLLRAVEQQEFERVGGEDVIRVDVRLICATKKNLRELVDAGNFREDLYYRLDVINLVLPPLRDRGDDIPLLARHFIAKHAPTDVDADPPTLTPHAMDMLVAHDWPGNVRELEHVIERVLTFCEGDDILPEHLPPLIGNSHASGDGSPRFTSPLAGLTETVADLERTMIQSALRRANGNQVRAAEILRIPRTTLRDKMSKYRIAAQEASSTVAPSPSGEKPSTAEH
jgi:DNA-binding NtrC family response regulator